MDKATDKLSTAQLAWLVRDARCAEKSDRTLLMELALRAKYEKGRYVCWPAYALLAKDTLLDEATLQRAAKRLEGAGLIRRQVRQNRSNRFYINVARLSEAALAERERDKQEAEEAEIGFPEDRKPLGYVPEPDDADEEAEGDNRRG